MILKAVLGMQGGLGVSKMTLSPKVFDTNVNFCNFESGVCVCVYVYVCVCMCVCVYVYVCVCMYVYVYMYVCIYVYVCM